MKRIVRCSKTVSYQYKGTTIYYKDGDWYIYRGSRGQGKMVFSTDKDAEEFIDSQRGDENVSSSTILANEINLGSMSKYYKVAGPNDIEWDEGEDNDVKFTLQGDYGVEFLGWAVAKSRYYDRLADDGLEYAAIGRSEDTGEIGLYLVVNNTVYDMEEEVRNVFKGGI